jgi:hypothetical protein
MLHPAQQTSKQRRHTGEMQQAKPRERRAGLGILSFVAVLVLLGTAAVLGAAKARRDRRSVGLMPEIVCTADRSRMAIEEIVVSAPRPDRSVGAVARLSGINK